MSETACQSDRGVPAVHLPSPGGTIGAPTHHRADRQQPSLTPREREVLILVALGWSKSHIADNLCLTAQTVRNYTSRLYAKLGVASRAEAIAWARENVPEAFAHLPATTD